MATEHACSSPSLGIFSTSPWPPLPLTPAPPAPAAAPDTLTQLRGAYVAAPDWQPTPSMSTARLACAQPAGLRPPARLRRRNRVGAGYAQACRRWLWRRWGLIWINRAPSPAQRRVGPPLGAPAARVRPGSVADRKMIIAGDLAGGFRWTRHGGDLSSSPASSARVGRYRKDQILSRPANLARLAWIHA